MVPQDEDRPDRFSPFFPFGRDLQGKGQKGVKDLRHRNLGNYREIGRRDHLKFDSKLQDEKVIQHLGLRDSGKGDPFIAFFNQTF